MDDLCECVCEYIWAMRRVLAAMHTQTQCTDIECFTEHPGYEPGSGEDDSGSGGLTHAMLVVLLWVIIAVVLFLFRPRSLRGSPNGKPPLRDNGEMPGILKTHEVEDEERCEGERESGEGVTEQKNETAGRISNRGGKGEEERGEEREGSSTTCSTPDAADLDNSSSTMASTEGDSDSKNGDSPPSSLGNPLPDGSDRTQRDGGNQSGGTKGSASGGGLGKTSLPLSCEISTVVLRLALPGVSSPVEVVMSTRDTVHDLSQLLLERPESCYRTCTSAWHRKRRLDDFSELGMVEELQGGDLVELMEEPYTQKDIRIHLQRLRELLTVSPFQQSLTNADGMTLSLLSAITLRDP
ncbi:Clustered mitochondria protein homolog [Geodia barretti]|nr:Clustered mitochondria protein homolog [Geodia barretti]